MRDVHGGRHGRLLPRDDLEHVDGDAEHDRVGEAHGDGHPVEVVPPDVGADGELVRGALQYTAGNDGSQNLLQLKASIHNTLNTAFRLSHFGHY